MGMKHGLKEFGNDTEAAISRCANEDSDAAAEIYLRGRISVLREMET